VEIINTIATHEILFVSLYKFFKNTIIT